LGLDERGFKEGARAANLSVWTLAGLGIIEIGMASVSGSVGLLADGVDSLADALISFLVYLGLKLSRRAPDERFHFGYYKFESFVSFVTSIGMIAIAGFLIHRSYLAFIEPRPLSLPILALLTLLIAGTVSLWRALQMRRIAKRYRLLSLDLDAKNGIKDAAASYSVFWTILASSLGYHQMDAVGGFIVSMYILGVSYVALREASLVLLDAFHSPELVDEISRLVKRAEEVKSIHDVRLRRSGPFIFAEIVIAVDGLMTVKAMHELIAEIEKSLKQSIVGIRSITVKALPDEEPAPSPT
jgi:cation diffusion facilitator family transporter